MMLYACIPGLLLIAWRMPSLTQWGILGGLALLTLGMIFVIGTRWGQSHPLANCIALSIVAHLLLVIYAFTTHFLFHNPAATNGYQQVARVRIVDDEARDEAEPTPAIEPEESLPEEEIPLPQEQVVEDQPVDNAASSAPALLAAPAPQPMESVEAQSPEPTPTPEQAPPLIAQSPDVQAEPSPMQEVVTVEPPPLPTPVATTVKPIRPADGSPLPPTYAPRVADREALLAKYGGDANTERAVQAALEWLAKNQSADGRWDPARFGAGRETKTLGHDRGGCGAQASTGISSLAVLAFLGSGETHLSGPHREQVQHALEYILASQAADGSLAGQAEFFAAMYCHSISMLAVSEAYAMTGDRRLEPALTRAVEFSVHAQHSSGSWRYRAQEHGDMSQFGWHVMAFRSAQMGEIKFPAEVTARMKVFLERCSLGESRGLGSYRPGDAPSRTMTAEALACRYFLQSSNSPAALQQAANYINEEPPTGRMNLYYWYYGSVALFQRGGKDWERWNNALKPALLNTQRSDGDYAGTWDPDIYWGGYGGRVFSTALGALCLETYYRHLPVTLDDEERELRWTNLPTDLPK